jgi:elongation factor G
MGELHLEILVDRMKREFNVEANVGKPQVAYRETIMGNADVENKYIKQTGGKGQYGHVKIKMKHSSRLIRKAKVAEERHARRPLRIHQQHQGRCHSAGIHPAVEKGIREAMDRGILAGYPMVDVS